MKRSKDKAIATLPELMEMNRNAATVYLALRWLANDGRQLNTTRPRIAEVCGLSLRLISRAVHALRDSGWIRMSRGWQQKPPLRAWYRVSFPAQDLFPVGRKTTHKGRKRRKRAVGRKTTHKGSSDGMKNDPQGRVPCGTFLDVPRLPLWCAFRTTGKNSLLMNETRYQVTCPDRPYVSLIQPEPFKACMALPIARSPSPHTSRMRARVVPH